MVDMTTGRCECPAGKVGSPCWYQFCLWSSGFASCPNFSPNFDKTERQKFAEIAIGSSLDSPYYETLHSFSERNENVDSPPPSLNPPIDATSEVTSEAFGTKVNAACSTMNEIAEEFDKFCDSVKKMMRSDNSEFNNSLTKFMKRYNQFSESQRVSTFQNFGSIFV